MDETQELVANRFSSNIEEPAETCGKKTETELTSLVEVIGQDEQIFEY